MRTLNMLAFDLGASNGRAICGRFDGNKLTLTELYRFENSITSLRGRMYWDILRLYRELICGFSVFGRAGFGPLDSFGIDTWGVDYGLIDKNGRLLGNPVCYRNSTDEDMEAVWKTVSKRELFDRTGIASLNFNTLYQLYARSRENDAPLEKASCMLMMPDLLGYFLTGEKAAEYTNATTGMMVNYRTKSWDTELMKKLGLPEHILPEMDRAGKIRGSLEEAVACEAGINRAAFATVGTHDTASAVAAIPGKGSFAFCSSGTWSLFGVETDSAIINDSVFEANFSNEGTVQGGCRPLKNIMGLWIIQECRREWKRQGRNYSWDDIVHMAEAEKPLRSIIDPDYHEFFKAGDMPEKIVRFCRRTGQPVPETDGQIARAIYESLALKYKWALERLEEIKGHKIETLNIVGGGIQNKLLNRMAANAAGRQVITGPIEGAAIGNLLMQAVALGELSGIEDVREVVRRSETTEVYEPDNSPAWQDAYGKLLSILEE